MYDVAASERTPTDLFDDPTLYGVSSTDGRAMRAYALGGVLSTLRAQRGWSVEQAAVHSGIGHMTWRRMEDGLSVRARTYTVVDTLFELPFGTARRALQDDLLMVQLIARVGVPADDVTVATASGFIERFANQTMSRNARAAVARGVRPSRSEQRAPSGMAGVGILANPVPALSSVSDVEAVANVLDRLTKYRMTPEMETAVRSLLDVMPVLIERSLAAQSTPLPAAEG